MEAAVTTPVRAAARVIWKWNGGFSEANYRLGGDRPGEHWQGVPLAGDTLWVDSDHRPALVRAWAKSATSARSLWHGPGGIRVLTTFELAACGSAAPLGWHSIPFGAFTLQIRMDQIGGVGLARGVCADGLSVECGEMVDCGLDADVLGEI